MTALDPGAPARAREPARPARRGSVSRVRADARGRAGRVGCGDGRLARPDPRRLHAGRTPRGPVRGADRHAARSGVDRRPARLPLARRGRARDPAPGRVPCLATGSDRAARDRGGPSARRGPAGRPGRGGPVRALRGLRAAAADRRHRPRPRPARRRPRYARSGQGLDGGRPGLAAHVRRGARVRGPRPSTRPASSSRSSSTPSGRGAIGPRTTRSACSGSSAARSPPTGASRTSSTTPSSSSRAARRRRRSSSATRPTGCSTCRRRPGSATLGDPATFARFLEEVLRHTTVVHLRARRATDRRRARWRHGPRRRTGHRHQRRRQPRPGCAGSAPDELDPDRPRLWGHLAFNVGPRHCAGAHLARMEATEAMLGMWRAFPDLARAPGAAAAGLGRLRVARLAPDRPRPRAGRDRRGAGADPRRPRLGRHGAGGHRGQLGDDHDDEVAGAVDALDPLELDVARGGRAADPGQRSAGIEPRRAPRGRRRRSGRRARRRGGGRAGARAPDGPGPARRRGRSCPSRRSRPRSR